MTAASDHDYDAAAHELNVTASWLKKHIRTLPHIKYGHLVRFTDEHLAQIRAMHEQRPGSTPPADTMRPSTRRRAS